MIPSNLLVELSVINKELREKLFSQESLFQPVARFPSNHWYNKNRRLWTPEELEAFWKEHLGNSDFNLQKPKLLLKPFNEKEEAFLINHEIKNSKLVCGKVIKIGELAFDKISFPFGATCTYNDWIMYNPISAERIDLNNKKFFLLDDRDVNGVINDPTLIIYNNKEKPHVRFEPI